jgi:hypothetical protein
MVQIPVSIKRFYQCPGKCRKEDIEGEVCEHNTCDYEHPPQQERKDDARDAEDANGSDDEGME